MSDVGTYNCLRCGHAMKDHIYETGACRPGFICQCLEYRGPITIPVEYAKPYQTMTLREYFAAMAMQGMFSDPKLMELIKAASNSYKQNIESIMASSAVSHADALIAELEKDKK